MRVISCFECTARKQSWKGGYTVLFTEENRILENNFGHQYLGCRVLFVWF